MTKRNNSETRRKSILGYSCMLNSRNSNESKRRAVNLLSDAANSGDITSAYNLGVHLLNGWAGRFLSRADAFGWLLHAATAGDAMAICNLGVAIETGACRFAMLSLAELYQIAYSKGSMLGGWNLARCYLMGIGHRKQNGRSKKIFGRILPQMLKLAGHEDDGVTLALAKSYMNGWGVVRSVKEGEIWYRKAEGARRSKVT